VWDLPNLHIVPFSDEFYFVHEGCERAAVAKVVGFESIPATQYPRSFTGRCVNFHGGIRPRGNSRVEMQFRERLGLPQLVLPR
jgi:hypothetical protein